MKKRTLSLILVLCMVATVLSGCGTPAAQASQNAAAAATTTTEAKTETEAPAEAVAPVVKDSSKTYSIDDEYEPWVWEVAVNNENFRKAIFNGVNRASTYYVATGDEEVSKTYIQNTVVPATFVTDENGKDYTEYEAFADITAADFFNPEQALAYRDAAMTELAAEGVTFPVKVLVRYRPSTDNWEEQSTILEQQLEAVLNAGDVNFIDVCVLAGPDDNFLTATRRNCNYMLQLCNWGADYLDPETFSEPFYQSEDSTKACGYNRGGRYAYMAYSISDGMAAGPEVAEYFALVEKAMAITDDNEARFAAFAEAEAYMIDHAFIIPYGTEVPAYVVSKLNPFEGQNASYGISNQRYKGQHLLDNFLSMDQFVEAANGDFSNITFTDTDNDVYRVLYSGDPTTLNYLITGTTAEQAIGANTVDTLVEYDNNGVMKPSLAKDWSYDEETLTWTFNLRDDATWVDSQGNFVANVTANDFVAAAKYILTPAMQSQTADLMTDVLANADAYFEYLNYLDMAKDNVVAEDGTTYVADEEGNVTVTPAEGDAFVVAPVSFEEVGVKAVDDYTLTYTLSKAQPYFLSLMTYVTYMPAYGPQLEELGTKFATSADTMYYCGAFRLETYEPQVLLVYAKNDSNWDAEHVYLEKIERKYNAEEATIGAEMAKRGEIDYCSLDADVADAWLADASTANMVSRERTDLAYSYFYCFNFNVYQLDETFYR